VIDAGTIQALIKLRDEMSPALSAAMKNLERAGEQGKKLGEKFESVGRALLPMSAGFAALGGGAVYLAGKLEQVKIGFTTMLGSAQKADAFIQKLRDFAAATPFQFTDLTTASQRLLAFGFSAEKIVPMLTAVGDAVAGLGGGSEKIQAVTLALGQMQAKGKVSAQEMMQLTEAGVSAWDYLAKSIGKSVPEAMKMAEQGAIAAGPAIEGIIAGMNEKFGGLMAAQSQTLLGLASTVKDNLEAALTDLGTVLMPAAKGAVNAFTAMMPAINGATAAFAKMPEPLKMAAAGLLAIGAGAAPAILGIGKLITTASALSTAVAGSAKTIMSFADTSLLKLAYAMEGTGKAALAAKVGITSLSAVLVGVAAYTATQAFVKLGDSINGINRQEVSGGLIDNLKALPDVIGWVTERTKEWGIAGKMAIGVLTAGIPQALSGIQSLTDALARMAFARGAQDVFDSAAAENEVRMQAVIREAYEKTGVAYKTYAEARKALKASMGGGGAAQQDQLSAKAQKELASIIAQTAKVRAQSLSGMEREVALIQLEIQQRKQAILTSKDDVGTKIQLVNAVEQLGEAQRDAVVAAAEKESLKAMASAERDLMAARIASTGSIQDQITLIGMETQARIEELKQSGLTAAAIESLSASYAKLGENQKMSAISESIGFLLSQRQAAEDLSRTLTDDLASAFEEANAAQADLAEDAAIVELSEGMRGHADVVEEVVKKYREMKALTADQKKVLDDATRVFRENGAGAQESLNKQAIAMADMNAQLRYLETANPDTLIAGLMMLGMTADQAREAIEKMKNELRDATGASTAIGAALKDLPKTILETIQGGGDIGKAVGASLGGSLGKDLGKGLTSGIGGALGSALPVVGTMLGSSLGSMLSGVFAGKPEYEKAMEEAGRDYGIKASEGLGKAIEETAASLDLGRFEATLLHLGDVMGEGLEQGKAVADFKDGIDDLFNAIANGAVPAEQGMAELGEVFTQVADAAEKAGRVGDRTMVDMLNRARQLGTMTEEMKTFVKEALSSAQEGISSTIARYTEDKGEGGNYLGGLQLVDPEVARAQAGAFSDTFWASVKEFGLVDAADAMRDSFGALKESLTEILPKEEINKLLGPMSRIFNITKPGGEDGPASLFRGAAEAAQGLAANLKGLADTGYLTQESFSRFGTLTKAAFDQAKAGGANTKEAITAILPELQAAVSAAQQYGYALDPATQKLKEQAEAAGFSFPVEPTQIMIDLLKEVVTVMGGEIPASAQTASSSVTGAADVMKGSVEGAKGALEGAAASMQDAAGSAVDALGQIAPEAQDTFASVADAAANSFDNMAASAASAAGQVSAEVGALSGLAIDIPVSYSGATGGINPSAGGLPIPSKFGGGFLPTGGGTRGQYYTAAAGFGPVKLAEDTVIQAHKGEHAMVIPAGMRVAFRSAAQGLMAAAGGMAGTGGGGMAGTGGGGGGTDMAGIGGALIADVMASQRQQAASQERQTQQTEQLSSQLDQLSQAVQNLADKPSSVTIPSTNNININESPLGTAQSRKESGQFVAGTINTLMYTRDQRTLKNMKRALGLKS
jgi:tape measure domain-containing protein